MNSQDTTFTLRGVAREIGPRLILQFDEASSKLLPSRGQVAVQAAVDGEQLTFVIEPDGRRGHWLPLDQPQTQALGVNAGSEISFEATVAAQWPETTVPEDLDQALAEAEDLSETWQGLTPMARWEWVRWVKATKNPQTRQRRVEVSISKLRDGKRRPCCFDLSSCTEPEVAKSGKLAI